MARGKEALLAANRRCTAAHEVIDRLTTEVADYKLRAKLAEQRIQELEPKAALTEELEAQRRDDRLLANALEALQVWRRLASKDWDRRKAAIDELNQLALDLMTFGSMGYRDAREFMTRRYPRLFDALTAGGTTTLHRKAAPTFWKLSVEDRRRLDCIRRERRVPEWDPEADMADVLTDLLDAKQIGLSHDETLELLGVTR